MTDTQTTQPQPEASPAPRRGPLAVLLGAIVSPRATFVYLRDHGELLARIRAVLRRAGAEAEGWAPPTAPSRPCRPTRRRGRPSRWRFPPGCRWWTQTPSG